MNTIRHPVNKPAFVLTALLGALTGCTTYVVERPAPFYVAPEPAPVIVDAPVAPAVVVIQTESDFYQPLAPYGRWVDVPGYGRAWVPGGVASDWRPYSNGHWERTEAGWFWVSDEPWAWATYHYGRWDYAPDLGWYWVPQTQWAPAWVAWRSGGGYAGWAPLPPSSRMERGVRVEVDVNAIAPRSFVFVEERRFTEPQRPATVIVNNTEIINQTVIISHTTIVNKTVINSGPPVAAIEKSAGHAVPAIAVKDLRRTAESPVAARRPAAPARPVAPPAVVQRPAAPKAAEVRPAVPPAGPKPPAIEASRPKPPVTQPSRPATPPAAAQRPAAPKAPEVHPTPPPAKPGDQEKTEPKPAPKDEKKKPDQP